MSAAVCKHCDTPLSRRQINHDAQYCSRLCWLTAIGAVERKKAEHPPCEYCDGPVLRRENEEPAKWLGRRFCCASHAQLARRKTEPSPYEYDVAGPMYAGPDTLPAGCFDAHNINTRDGGFMYLERPPTHVDRIASS